MQQNTFCPGLIVDRYTLERWFLRRDDDGVKRYHQTPADRGRMPSAFFNHSGSLKSEYRAI